MVLRATERDEERKFDFVVSVNARVVVIVTATVACLYVVGALSVHLYLHLSWPQHIHRELRI